MYNISSRFRVVSDLPTGQAGVYLLIFIFQEVGTKSNM